MHLMLLTASRPIRSWRRCSREECWHGAYLPTIHQRLVPVIKLQLNTDGYFTAGSHLWALPPALFCCNMLLGPQCVPDSIWWESWAFLSVLILFASYQINSANHHFSLVRKFTEPGMKEGKNVPSWAFMNDVA